MNVTRRRQADRTAATRGLLVAAARTLFAEHGFADVGTERIARAAGVTRGALYHQFDDKTELFAAVLEAVEGDVMGRLVAVVDAAAASGATDPVGLLVTGIDGWLDSCADPEVQRIVLVDGPAVLGWERWREVGERYGMGLVATLLTELMDAGAIDRQPVEPLAHVLIGALDEAALYVARAPDPDTARAEVR
ncbi:MAG: TetR/AcrR family transcriptional regulator, partial [Ilumatobacteraceae bacterium]